MRIIPARQRQIEEILREEFEAEGYAVVDDKDNLVAEIDTFSGDGTFEYTKINLTRLAAQIDARLP